MFSAHVPNLWPRVKAFREFMGSAFKYFQEGSLRYEEEVDTTGTRPTIVCVHPHGIFPLGWGMLTTRPEVRIITTTHAHTPDLHPNPSRSKLSATITT